MSNLLKHAETELKLLGLGADCECEYDQAIRKAILDIVTVFSSQGHSGYSASLVSGVVAKLLEFTPLSPLTGEDSEWEDVSQCGGGVHYQNKRCSRVFKDTDGSTYDIEGIIFYEYITDEESGERRKNHYNSIGSSVPVVFPYTPKTEYVELAREI